MSLNQTQIDLRNYAHDKLGNFLKDVMQSFEIADLSKAEMVGCLGAVFQKAAAAIAIAAGADKGQFLQVASEVYDIEKLHHERYHMKGPTNG